MPVTTLSHDPTLPAGLMFAVEVLTEYADPASPAGQADVLSLAECDAAVVLVAGRHEEQKGGIYALSRFAEAAGLGGVWIALGPAAWALALRSRHPGSGDVKAVVTGLIKQAGFFPQPADPAVQQRE